MTTENDKDTIEITTKLLNLTTFTAIKGVLATLDLLLSRCNSFEDFKISVKQTIDNLTKTGEENEKH